jgi:uncharacterized protein (TIGR01777 family)
MPNVTYRSVMPASAEAVFAWHARPGALERLMPPWEHARVVGRTGGIADRGRVELAMRVGPAPVRWVAQHTDYEPGVMFRDEQVEGPFAHWVHTHRVIPIDDQTCELVDSVDYALPLGVLGAIAGGPAIHAMLDRMFRFRHARTRLDLMRHAEYAFDRPLRVAVTGASGLVGTQLTAFLTTGGHTVVPLVRREVKPGEDAIRWDPARGLLNPDDLEGFDAVVHLAGENIAEGRWTPERKARILESRETSTRLLATTLARLKQPPRVLVSASGISVYGDRGDALITESSSEGTGFLADVVRAWEAGTAPAKDAGLRVVNLRIAPVITPAGGPLAKLLLPYQLGLGGPVGSGKQYFPWIDMDDLLAVVLHAIRDVSLSGPVNTTAPTPVTNAELARTLGHVLHRPAFFPLPTPVVLAAFGQMGQEALLEGQRAVPARLEASGFRFAHPTLESALDYELGYPEPAGAHATVA